MRNKLLALCLSAALLSSAAVRADNRVTPIDYGIESSSKSVLMPSSSTGSVVFTCDTCKNRSFTLTPQTLFKIGPSEVSFAEFSASVRAEPARSLMVFVKPSDKTITRMTVSGPAAAPAK